MARWDDFKIDGTIYDLSHLNNMTFDHVRAATSTHPEKTTKIILSFSHHCFTDHQGDHIYPHDTDERYFCVNRYGHSKMLPELIPDILNRNEYVKRTFNEHREQFFYLEESRMNIDYRLFLEVHKSTSKNADIRIDVRSAYEPAPYSRQVTGNADFKILRVIDARLEAKELPKKRKR